MLKKLLRVIAGSIVGVVLLLAALLVWPLPEMPRQGVAGDFLIRDVAIVDVEAGVLREGRNVVVLDGRIVRVGSAGTAQVQESLVVIDGTGKYLMPGLWDMHTHSLKISPQYHHPLFIANGVTGVREMSGCMAEPDSFLSCIDDLERWNKALGDKSGLSPRYVLKSSFLINGGDEVPDRLPEFFKARDAREARELVAFYVEAGVDSLKTYSNLSPAAYRALADGAREHGISATIDAALFSGKENEFGSIDAGKVADMILLNADPLADIRNTQQIEGLFFNGQYFDRAALDQLLEFAEQQAGSFRTNLNVLWDAVNSPIVRMQIAD